MRNMLLSIDPGVSSAWALIECGGGRRPELASYAQFGGGTEALIEQVRSVTNKFPLAHVIYEDFTARNTGTFGYTTASLEPLVGIGALMAMGVIDRNDPNQRCAPALQYFLPGRDLAEKKKKRRIWLAENGFRVMPKDVGQPDCDDVRSAISHGIAWLRRNRDPGTLEMFREKESND